MDECGWILLVEWMDESIPYPILSCIHSAVFSDKANEHKSNKCELEDLFLSDFSVWFDADDE